MKHTFPWMAAAAVLALSSCGSSATTSAGPSTTGAPSSTSPIITATATLATTATPTTTVAQTATTVSDVTPHLSSLLFGTATPNLPVGEAGKVTVVQTDDAFHNHFYTGTYRIVVRNNTDKTVSDINVTGAARSGGALIGSGDDQGFDPRVLNPGETAFGFVFFENSESIPADATFDFKVTSSADDAFTVFTDVQVTEANLVPAASSYDHDTVVGSVTNNTDKDLTLVSVTVHCFDGDRYQGSHGGHISEGLAPGATGTFSATLYDNCPSFLVYASGF